MGGHVCILGSANLDLAIPVPHFPGAGETVLAGAPMRHAGGKGLNQAVAAARLGAQVRFAGAVGDDDAGAALRAALAADGVDVSSLAVHADTATGQAVIAVSPTGENSIIVMPGANRLIAAEAAAKAAAGTWDIFLAQLEVPLEAVHAFFAAARGGRILLNAAPALPAARPLLPLCDIVIVNRGELAQMAGAPPPDDLRDMAAMAGMLGLAPHQTVVVTLGRDGALALTGGEMVEVPGMAAEAADTTGAGDCFCGALSVALAEGRTMAEALAFANHAAALSVSRAGASSAMPRRREMPDA